MTKIWRNRLDCPHVFYEFWSHTIWCKITSSIHFLVERILTFSANLSLAELHLNRSFALLNNRRSLKTSRYRNPVIRALSFLQPFRNVNEIVGPTTQKKYVNKRQKRFIQTGSMSAFQVVFRALFIMILKMPSCRWRYYELKHFIHAQNLWSWR